MWACGCRAGALVVAALALLPAAWAQPTPPPTTDKKPPPTAPSIKPPDTPKPRLDLLRFPADAIIVLCKEGGDVLSAIPGAIVLRPEKYQEMRDEIARLTELVNSRKSVPPSRCQLTGKIDGGLVLLKAQFDFVTDRPDTVVTLACGQAVATAADLDGHTPQFRPEADGFSVVVDKPGDHQVKLDLAVGLSARDGVPAIDLALPRAAITIVDIDLPKGATDLRLSGRPLPRVLSFKDGKLSGPLGSVDRLDLAYKEARPVSAAAVPVADGGRIMVHVTPDGMTTEADLTLLAEAGMVSVWQVLVPRGAVLRLAPEDQARLAVPIEAADQPVGSLRTLRLREPSAAPLKVSITARGPKPQPGATLPVGPFTVVGAARQAGILLVSNTVPELHLDYRIRAGLRRQPEPPEEERQPEQKIVAAFRYGGILPDVAPKGAGRSSWYGPWLDLDPETVRGQIKAHVSHVLALQADGKDGFVWQATMNIEAESRWADVDQLKVVLPAGWVSAEEPETGAPAGDRTITRRLLRGPGEATQRVTLTLKGRYLESYRATGEVRLRLPRPVGVIDGGAEITLSVASDQELLSPAVLTGLEAVRMTPHEQAWHCATLPDAITASWRPYIPDIRVESIADIDLKATGANVWRHEFHLRLPQPSPEQLTLRVPPGIEALQIQTGGSLIATTDKTRRIVRLDKEGPADGRLVVLSYLVRGAVPGSKEARIPLVAVEPASQSDIRARLWSEPGRQPMLSDGGGWRESAIEEVAQRRSLPVLVARTTQTGEELVLRPIEQSEAETVLIERAVVRVQIADNGTQTYVVQWRLRRLAAATIEVELPAPVRTLDLQARLGQLQVQPEAIDDAGRPSEAGRVARLKLDAALLGKATMLELQYRLTGERALASNGDPGLLATLLSPPVLRQSPGPVPCCWQVRVPATWVVLSPESGPGAERVWSWRGRLPALRLRTPLLDDETESADSAAAAPLDVLRWQGDPRPLLLVHVPQQAWLLACSLVSVIFGLVVLGARAQDSGGRWRAATGVLLLLVVAATGVLRPTILAAVLYGCQPGVMVLAVILPIQWLLHERYRRQFIFLPSFTRKRSGSSLKPPPRQAPGEPSTIDHPRPAGSSASRR
jgi:hypothetical protein